MEKQDNYPAIVYKYRNWSDEHHKSVLYKNQLFLTSPKDFNDPFDCRIPQNFSLLDSKERIQKYVDKSIIRQFTSLNKENRNIESEIAKWQYRITNELDKVQEEYEKLLYTGIDSYYGVLSLSERWDSILMWSHYANCHEGYCVGFWEKKFRESGNFAGGKVSYPSDNKFPDIDPLDEDTLKIYFTETHSKSREWSYEKEYRLTRNFFPEIPTNDKRTIIIPDSYFAEIIIGLKISNENREEIIQIARGKNVKIFQAQKTPFKFEINREEIK